MKKGNDLTVPPLDSEGSLVEHEVIQKLTLVITLQGWKVIEWDLFELFLPVHPLGADGDHGHITF